MTRPMRIKYECPLCTAKITLEEDSIALPGNTLTCDNCGADLMIGEVHYEFINAIAREVNMRSCC
jgi:hypothetical protein